MGSGSFLGLPCFRLTGGTTGSLFTCTTGTLIAGLVSNTVGVLTRLIRLLSCCWVSAMVALGSMSISEADWTLAFRLMLVLVRPLRSLGM